MTNKLFVGNISWGASEEDLTKAFSAFGEVQSARIITDKFSGKSKGFGFIEMDSEESATAAKENLHDTELDGRELKVDFAQERQD